MRRFIIILVPLWFFGCSEKPTLNNNVPMANTSGYATDCDSAIDAWRNLDDLNCRVIQNEMIAQLLSQSLIIEALIDSLIMARQLNVYDAKDTCVNVIRNIQGNIPSPQWESQFMGFDSNGYAIIQRTRTQGGKR